MPPMSKCVMMIDWLVAFVAFLCLPEAASQHNLLEVTVQYPSEQLPPNSLVALRGDHCGLSWDEDKLMKPSGENIWVLSLVFNDSEAGEILSCKVLLNGQFWQQGANTMVKLSAGSSKTTLFPWFFTSQGSYKVVPRIYSPQLDNWRDLVVYVPPSYDENPFKLDHPLLVMHDGENLFNDSTSFLGVAWHCQDTVDTLVAEGLMTPLVMVGVYNTINRTDEYTYSVDASEGDGGNADTYLDFLEQTVLPFVRQHYRVDAHRSAGLGLLGSSLGGLVSCYAGWTRGTVWAAVGCMSSSFWWNKQDFNTTILHKARPPGVRFYLDSGDQGDGQDDKYETLTVRAHMEALGLKEGSDLFYYLDHGGWHNETFWGRRFHYPMTALYPPQVQSTQPV